MDRRIVIPLIGGVALIILVGAGISFQLSRSSLADEAVVTASPTATQSPIASSLASSTPTPAATQQVLGDATFNNGSYQAEGSYQTPAGTEKIAVDLTLKDNKVSAVTVTPLGRDPQSRKYEGQFAAGIASVVVGRPLGDLTSVGKVNGSSLTGNGFSKALEAIRNQARRG